MAVLLAKYLRYDFATPHDPHNDRLVFSKGHASTLLYAMFRAAGAISEDELLTYRQFDSIFEGHPTPRAWVDVATGSLGQGLPYSVGIALAGKRLDRLPFRVWTLCGDSEIAEGSQWEALEHAAHFELDNLVAIIDVNRLGQRGETMHGWDLDSYADRARAFGCHAIEIDGHDVEAIDRRVRRGDQHRRPAGRDRRQDDQGQGRPRSRGQTASTARRSPLRRGDRHARRCPPPRDRGGEAGHRRPEARVPDRAARAAAVRARGGGRDAEGVRRRARRARQGARRRRRARRRGHELDLRGGVPRRDSPSATSRCTSPSSRWSRPRSVQVLGWRPFASTFAAFLSRAYDFIRMSA